MKILRSATLVDRLFIEAEFLILTIMDRFLLDEFDFPCNESNIVIISCPKIWKIKPLLPFNWSHR